MMKLKRWPITWPIKQIRRLPVVNEQKQLVGIVSLGDLATSKDALAPTVALSGISQTGGPHNQTITAARG
jgi:CBS-domain-containing membrane protein